MYFVLSKVLWVLVEPLNIIFLMVFVATLCLFQGRVRIAKRLLLAVAVCSGTLLVFPFGDAMIHALEQRFPIVELPQKVDGIILLGGAQRPLITQFYHQPGMNGAAETMTTFLALARAYPKAKLVFSGGSGDIRNQHVSESDTIKLFFKQQGFDDSKVLYESRSRNTYENVNFSKALVQPKPAERWLVVTSAVGVPRVVGTFRQAGWDVTPVPCSFTLLPKLNYVPSTSFDEVFSKLSKGLHEWAGLLVYYLSGKTNALFPAPVSNA